MVWEVIPRTYSHHEYRYSPPSLAPLSGTRSRGRVDISCNNTFSPRSTLLLFDLPFAPPLSQDYDGGDCCSCTCVDLPGQECGGFGGFACIDPDALCVDDDDITVGMLEECEWVGGIGKASYSQGGLFAADVHARLSPYP